MSTYTPIASQVLTSNTASITFSGIPQNYTDLIIVIRGSSTNYVEDYLRFNSDSGSNYSTTRIYTNASTSVSDRFLNANSIVIGDTSSGGETATVIQIPNYSNSTTYKSILIKSGYTSYIFGFVGMWRSTAAVTSIDLFVNSGAFISGATFNLYGIQSGNALATKATGGNIIVSSGGYWYHAFTSSGTFTPNETLSCDYLVIAGGGAGGKIYGGGGGAGGFRSATSQTLTAGNYPVIVGAGGAVVNLNFSVAGNGSDSSINSLLSTGGGGGASDQQSGASGGSGGGGGYRETGGGGGGSNAGGSALPVTSPVQGYAGGTGGLYGGFPGVGAGGGGGATAVGGTGGSNSAGNGGAGSNAFSTWASATGTGVSGYYAGGGGGGKDTGSAGSGGAGGGGAGSASGTGTPGTPNTGGGGGGGYNVTPPLGNGGSGIVIVRYAV